MANHVQSRNPFARKPLTADRLREVLSYAPETGAFYWLISTSNRAPIGERAGYVRNDGRTVIGVDGAHYLANRLAFLWMTGEWPDDEIDHKDNDASNDRWANLRPANSANNKANIRRRRDNTSGFKGVTYDKSRSLWQARTSEGGRTIHLGRFRTPEEAHAAYCAKAHELFGQFARTS